MEKKAIIEKVVKCLALAQSDNPHEAAAALRKAQRMMAEHGIEPQDVRLAAVTDKETPAGGWENPPRHVAMLAALVGEAFRCHPIFNVTAWWPRYRSAVRFVGVDPEPKLAAYAFDVLRRQLVAGRKRYLASLPKRLKRSTKTRRADLWAEGWTNAVWDKISCLVIHQDRKKLIADYIEAQHGALVKQGARTHKPRGRREWVCAAEGYIDGQGVSLNHGVGQELRPQIDREN